ncbi:MAG: lytic transglycosylase domain-containing protein [Methylococcaceae bacterium]|nr:lytic transglycosylase domain-containing protein [Methylococcaceae bacterium]MCI0734280.1 lytic transglycosylase domain-containing protein [Methylococcaceae bacterium]
MKNYSIFKMLSRIFWALLLFSLSVEASADIYKLVDENGRVTFTNVPLKRIPEGAEYTLVLKSLIRPRKRGFGTSGSFANHRSRKRYEPIILSAAERHHVDPKLIHAVIRAESSYNPNAVSHKGAVGLMQLMPQTADRYGVTDREDPDQNINGGVEYLSDLIAMFSSDIRLAVAAYNAGEQNVIKYGNKIPPFKETRQYVAKVMKFYRSNL